MEMPISRRRFFALAYAAAAAAMYPLVSVPKALARAMSIKEHMRGRIAAAYREDVASKHRFPQDNSQLCKMQELFFNQPMRENASEMLRTRWIDRSSRIQELRDSGEYPSPRELRFRNLPYPHDEE